ncbi:hypothetical protein B0J14DRAFT_682959 [Halenospora varia]|nr:hypothetical protein B0J14DRAFT_682959 [Halenospora varia]
MRLLRGTPLLSAAVAGSLFAMGSVAQSSSTASNTASNTNAKTSATTDAKDTTATTASGTKTTTGVITGSGSSAATTGTIPVIISGTATATDGGALTGLPTLSGAYKIVAPSVPPTSNAPYMQQSKLPEGTVFIAVGAILGFLAMSVLLWRGLVAWSLHRSVKRAALQQYKPDNKQALFRTPGPAPFYKDYHDRDSTISLSGLGPKSKKQRPTTGGGAHPSTGSLFFSPTAAAGGLNTAGNRGSNYLPAGYYAAGAASPGNNQSHIPVGGAGHGPAISMSNLNPGSAGYGRARSIGTSPPESPALMATRGHMASSSTLNLTHGYGGDQRAPSAYLEDLFDGEAGLPVPGHSRNASGGGTPRF